MQAVIATGCITALAALAACGRLGFDGVPVADAPAPSPDAMVGLLDTLSVPGDGTPTTSAVVLAAGVTYQLRASGTYYIAGGSDPYGDADYWDFTGASGPQDLCDDQMTDAGLSIDDPVVDGDFAPDWGPFRSDHRYQIDFIGKGAPITATIHDIAPGNNMGSLTLEIVGPAPR